MQNCFWLLFYLSVTSSLEMNDILKELSWPLKLKVLNEISQSEQKIVHVKPLATVPTKRRTSSSRHDPTTTSENFPPNDATPNMEPIPTNIERPSNLEVGEDRRVGIELLKGPGRQNVDEDQSDDKDMRLKLFRLMYETVRDSDLKVKRAELIKDHYTNSSSFEIGYLIGDITDKNNIINDISMTLKRFHKEWKPIEHINAYEQIANQAIEITHLIDLVRVVNKRGNDQN